MSEIIYYCEQGDPMCIYPKCTCNTVRPETTKNERNAGRKPLYGGKETVLMRVLIRKDKEKEMKSEIKAVQEKYKSV
jgi:hypothetical protein